MMKAKTPRSVCVLVVLLLAFLALPQIRAQVAGSTLSGTVTDQSNAVIANAQVAIKATSTGVTRSVTTDSAGLYAAPNLLPGAYEVTVTATGFSTAVQTGVTLTVGAQQVLNIKMQVGQVSQEVVVTSQAVDVQLTSSAISATVNSTTVRELPLNGRSWTDLATLQPGIVSMSSGQPGISGTSSATARGIRGFGNQLTISGARAAQNNYRLDGISENDYSNSSPGSVSGGAAGVDAIAEFSVITSNYSAEYGRTSGGVVNAITRSGTNQFHGDAYEFIRNDALDAPNYFDPNGVSPPFRRNQFGVAAGAPIWKDHTFVFANYEGFRQSLGNTFSNIVPSLDARNGILHNASGPDTIVTVDPKVAPFLALWHVPTEPVSSGANTGIYKFAAQQHTAENFLTAKVDHKFSDSDSIAGSFQWDRATATVPDTLNTVLIGQKTGHNFVSIEETHVFSPQLINTIRVGFNRSTAVAGGGIEAINPAASDPALSAVPGWDAPLIQPTGLTFFGGGLSNVNLATFAWNSYQLYDDAFLTKGNHTIKFGFAVERMQNNYIQASRVGGLVGFSSLQNFLTNIPSKFQVTFPDGVAPRGLRQTIYAGYVQDDYRVRPGLTVNLGLRYETSTAPIDVKGQLGRLLTVTAATVTTGNPYFLNPTKNNFEPRVGFAWDPFGDGKTSVRGGVGLFDVLPLVYQYSNMANNSAPFAIQGNVSGSALIQGDFPDLALAKASAPSKTRVTYIEHKPKRNYVEQWNLSIQRKLPGDFTGMVSYVGSHGVHMEYRTDDINTVVPTLTSGYWLYPKAIGSGSPQNSNWGRIDNATWSDSTSYNALGLLLEKKLSHGVQVQASYAWSKAMDTGSGAYLSDLYANSIPNGFFFDKGLRRAVSDTDVTHNLTINYTWIVPTPKSLSSAAQFALGGWQLGGIISARTGTPFTPILGGDPVGANGDVFDYPNRLRGSGCDTAVNPGNPDAYINTSCFTLPVQTPEIAALCTPFPNTPGVDNSQTCRNAIGNSARNSLIGPGLLNFDFSIFKNNYIRRISETFNVQFRVEMFNIFNRNNFNPPTSNNALYNGNGGVISTAGKIDSTSTTAREIQFGLKVLW
jgi:Carboxypeptidase regulatory-like domain